MLLHAPMKSLARRRLLSWSIVTAVSCATIGCDKVETLVNDAKQEVATQTAPAPVPAPTNAPAPAVAPVIAPAAVVVPPEQILAEFRTLPSTGITDAALAKLTASPEAASQITELDLTGNFAVTGSGLGELAKLPGLKSLKVAGMGKLQAAEFDSLARVTGLTSLDAASTQINNSNLPALASITGLETLNLSRTQVTGNGAGHLAALTNLKELLLDDTPTNDEAISAIKNLPLRVLRLPHAQVTNAAMAVIGEMTTLEELNISYTAITGAAFAKAKLTNLRILGVGETNFGVDGLIQIKRFKNLEELGMYRAQLHMDDGNLKFDPKADVFKGLPKLRKLNVGANGISDIGVARFIAGAKELEELHLALNSISDRGLAELLKCPKLQSVELTGTKVSGTGILALKAAVAKQKRPEIVVTKDGQTH